MLSRKRAYVKSYDGETKWMYFLIEDDDLLEKYNTVWDNVRAEIKKGFDSESIYNNIFLKAKIRSYGDETTDSHDKEILKVGSNLLV